IGCVSENIFHFAAIQNGFDPGVKEYWCLTGNIRGHIHIDSFLKHLTYPEMRGNTQLKPCVINMIQISPDRDLTVSLRIDEQSGSTGQQMCGPDEVLRMCSPLEYFVPNRGNQFGIIHGICLSSLH